MPDEKKKTEPENSAQQPQQQPETAAESTPAEAEAPADKPAEGTQTAESGEGADVPDTAPETQQQSEAAPPELSEIDKLKEENFRLKTQLEANTLGFMPDVIEDAVVLAENIVKRDGSDISAALKAVAKKYPAWLTSAQDDKSKGGFKVGADSSGGKSADDDEKLNKIFGIRKKK